jgi:hypothetical protein
MFPSADPVEYPNQHAAAGQSYDDILKSLVNDPSFPFPTTLNELRMQRAAGSGTFVPPSSTFMYNGGDANDQNQMYDNDVQLLGPMPAYMMQGSAFAQPNSSDNGGASDTINTPTDFTSQFLNQQGNHFLQAGGGQNAVANVNLEQLLGGEEWSGLNPNAGYASTMSQMFLHTGMNQPMTTATTSSGAGNTFNTAGQQTSQPASSADMNSARTSMDLNDRSSAAAQFGSKNVSFDDLNPGVLGWNLGNY